MTGVTRRDGLKLLAAASAAVAVECAVNDSRANGDARNAKPGAKPASGPAPGGPDPILGSEALGYLWPTRDPFLFCVHHDDRYPAGDDSFGPPRAMLAGRELGMDFEPRDGFRMYHGEIVPGFPRHPHRGFETVTVVRRGLLDHSDSLGAAARYGRGDVQWLTAGRGIQHAEMFPLVRQDAPNPVELFQIWLNLPSTHKMVDPHFSMLWSDSIPTRTQTDDAGKHTHVTIVAGRVAGTAAPPPPPNSWAAAPEHDMAIWTVKMQAGARWTLPAARAGVNRTLYVFSGSGLRASGRELSPNRAFDMRPELDVALTNGGAETEMLLLQGRPIGEPIVKHGPFVMNTRDEIAQAYADFQRTQFGGWPWPSTGPVHAREDRFARQPDGRIERPA